LGELGPDYLWNRFRILHLLECWTDNSSLSTTRSSLLNDLGVHSIDYFRHPSFLERSCYSSLSECGTCLMLCRITRQHMYFFSPERAGEFLSIELRK
jgi:hypothetical protein